MKKSPTKQKGKTQRKTRGEKTTTGKPDDDSKRRAEIEAKIRRRVALEEKAFRLVEKLLESPISEEFLIEAAQSIDHNHYADVVEERAIIKLCGYPVCTKSLTNIPKQKYHISTKTNKVYDITERKNFCSPQCYKASKYFEKQLSTTPVWLREVEPPVLIELLGIDSNSGSLGEVVFVSPRAELKAELSELERVDRKLGPKNTAAKQQQHGRGSGDNADIYCKGEAIGRKPAARSIVTACKNIDGVTEGKPSTRNDHQVITPRRSKHDDGQAVELKHKDNKVQVVGDRVESQGTTQDVHIGKGKPAREINSEGLPIEEVARSISNLCLERSLKNLEYLNSEEATEHAHGGVLENVELWKDGDTSVRSTEDDGSVRNSERHRSCNQSLEPLPVVIPSDDNLPDRNGQIEVPCLNAEQQHYNHATVPSLVANDHCGGDSLDSKTVSRSLASSSELLDTGEGQATDLAHSGTSVLSSGCSSQRAVLGTDDEDKDGGKHRGVCGEGDLPEQGQQDMDAESKDIVAAVNEGKMTVNTSHQEDLRQQKQSSLLPESDVGIAGLRTRAAVKCAASNKAQVLAELLDKRDELLTGLKAPVVDVEDEKKEAAAGLRTSGTSLGLLQLIDDCSDRETGQKSAASNTEDQMNIGVAPQSVHSARVASDGGNPSTRPPKTSSARIMANIRRASEQRNRIQNGSSVGLAPSGQRSGQASRIRGEAKSQKKSTKRTKGSVLELIRQTLFDWKTEETARFLSKDVRSIADEVADRCRKYSQMLAGREYSALLGDEALDDDGEDDGTPRGKLPSMSQLQTDQVYAARVMEFYGGLRQKEKKDAKGRIEEGAEKVTDADIILPMVDSHSQMAHRRKIVLDKLNKVFPELLGPLRVSVTEVSAELRSLVYTFNLTNTNIILKPAEWTLVAYFLLHLLTLCCPSLKQAMEGEVATHYFKTMLLSLNVSSSDVQQITERMSSVDR